MVWLIKYVDVTARSSEETNECFNRLNRRICVLQVYVASLDHHHQTVHLQICGADATTSAE